MATKYMIDTGDGRQHTELYETESAAADALKIKMGWATVVVDDFTPDGGWAVALPSKRDFDDNADLEPTAPKIIMIEV